LCLQLRGSVAELVGRCRSVTDLAYLMTLSGLILLHSSMPEANRTAPTGAPTEVEFADKKDLGDTST